jgi:hypothetical protein
MIGPDYLSRASKKEEARAGNHGPWARLFPRELRIARGSYLFLGTTLLLSFPTAHLPFIYLLPTGP